MTNQEKRQALTSVLTYMDRDLKISGIQNIESIYKCVSLIASVIASIDAELKEEKE